MKNPHHLKIKRLIDNIRKYDSLSLIKMVIGTGNIMSENDVTSSIYINEMNNRLAHYELDMLCILIHRYGDISKTIPTKNEFFKLSKKLRNLRNFIEPYIDEQVEQNNSGTNNICSLRILRRGAFNQFRYQNQQPLEWLARQYIMFVKLDKKDILNAKFKKLSTINIKEFLCIYFFFSDYTMRQHFIKNGLLKNFFTLDTLRGFFTLLSKDINDAKNFTKSFFKLYMHKNSFNKDINFLLFEATPFERYPFFKLEDDYIPYHEKLLYTAIENNLYDICKEADLNMCGEYNITTSEGGFGRIFEEYIYQGLRYYMSESDKKEKSIIYTTQNIKKKLSFNKEWPCVDFLLIEDNSGILIESKSTEYHKKLRIIQSKESRKKALEQQIKKGLDQIIYTANKLLEKNPEEIDKVKTLYGILITYKQYYLGSIEKFYNEMNNLLPIHPKMSIKNLFYLTIEEFDYLVAVAIAKNTTISKILSDLIDCKNDDYITFLMRLREFHNNAYRAQYLTNTLEEIKTEIFK